MAPKTNGGKPRRSTRSTTASVRSSEPPSDGVTNLVRRAAEAAGSRRRGESVADSLMHVRQGAVAGLSPAHVKAVYGYNGDNNVDPVGGPKRADFLDEAAEDEAFEEQLFGKKRAKSRMNPSASHSLVEDARKDLGVHELDDVLATNGALPGDFTDDPEFFDGDADPVPGSPNHRRSIHFPKDDALGKPPSPRLDQGRPVPHGSIRPDFDDGFGILRGSAYNAPSFSLYSSNGSIDGSEQQPQYQQQQPEFQQPQNQQRQYQHQLQQHQWQPQHHQQQSQHHQQQSQHHQQQPPQQQQKPQQQHNQPQHHQPHQPDDEPLRGPLGTVRPPLNPTALPNGVLRRDRSDQKGARNLFKAQVPNPNMTIYNRFQHPSEPPASLASKYGIPTGRATSEPVSPARPDSSRSFTQENVLYENATLQSPVSSSMPSVIHLKTPPTSTQSSSLHPIEERPLGVYPPRSGTDGFQPRDTKQTQSVDLQNGRAQSPTSDAPTSEASSPELPQQTAPEIPVAEQSDDDYVPLSGPRHILRDARRMSSEERENLSELRDRMLIRDENRPPKLVGPEGDQYPLANPNLTAEQMADVNTLRQRMANPLLGANPTITRAAPWDTAIHGPREAAGERGVSSSVSVEPEPPEKQAPRGSGPPLAPRPPRGLAPLGFATAPLPRRSWWTVDDYCWEVLRLVGFFGLLILGLLTCFHLGTKAFGGASDDVFAFGPRWYEWDSIKDSFGQVIPDSILHPLQSMGDASAQSLLDRLTDAEADVRGLKQQGKTFGKSLQAIGKKVTEMLPLTVDKDGIVKIPEEFWLALKEKARSDDIFWKPYLGDDVPSGPTKAILEAVEKHLGLKDVDGQGSKPSPAASDMWRQNLEAKIKRLESSQAPLNSEKDVKAHVEKLLQSGGGEFLVNSDQFKKQLTKELNGMRSSYQAELRELKDDIAKQLQELNKVRGNLPDGLSNAALTSLVTGLARKAMSDAQLQAWARAGAKAHAADHLANQVNFFGEGSGAVVDPFLTSEPWQLPRGAFKSKEFYDRTQYKVQPKRVALTHWEDEGECFCAHTDRKGFGQGTNNVSVLLGRDLTPHHLVVEHILPGATLDPDATPRDLEVWAYIEEVNLRQTLSGWSTDMFPDAAKETTLNEAWVKIGAFTYKRQDEGDGVQVFPFSTELSAYGVVTSHVLVRALNNYGADHTCFYRLKLFGHVHPRTKGTR